MQHITVFIYPDMGRGRDLPPPANARMKHWYVLVLPSHAELSSDLISHRIHNIACERVCGIFAVV